MSRHVAVDLGGMRFGGGKDGLARIVPANAAEVEVLIVAGLRNSLSNGLTPYPASWRVFAWWCWYPSDQSRFAGYAEAGFGAARFMRARKV